MLVYLFDYTCANCRTLHGVLLEAMREDAERFAVMMVPVPRDPRCNLAISRPEPEHANACAYARLALSVWAADWMQYAAFDAFLFDGKEPPALGRAGAGGGAAGAGGGRPADAGRGDRRGDPGGDWGVPVGGAGAHADGADADEIFYGEGELDEGVVEDPGEGGSVRRKNKAAAVLVILILIVIVIVYRVARFF